MACLLALSSLSLVGCNSTEPLEKEKVTQSDNNKKEEVKEEGKKDDQLIHTDFDQETTIEGASRFPLSTSNYFRFLDTITDVVKWLPGYNGEGDSCNTLSEASIANGFYAMFTFDSSIENVPLELSVSYSPEIDGEIHLEYVKLNIGDDWETLNTLENKILAKKDLVKYATLVSNALLPEGFMDIKLDFNNVINLDPNLDRVNKMYLDGSHSSFTNVSNYGDYLGTSVKFSRLDQDYETENLVIYNKKEMDNLKKTIDKLSNLNYDLQVVEITDKYSNICFYNQEKGSTIKVHAYHIDGKFVISNVDLIQTWGDTAFIENSEGLIKELNVIQKIFFDKALTKSKDITALNELFVEDGSQYADYFTDHEEGKNKIETHLELSNEHGDKEFSANMSIMSDEIERYYYELISSSAATPTETVAD